MKPNWLPCARIPEPDALDLILEDMAYIANHEAETHHEHGCSCEDCRRYHAARCRCQERPIGLVPGASYGDVLQADRHPVAAG